MALSPSIYLLILTHTHPHKYTEREKNWIKWKQESCKPFTVDPASTYRKRKKTMEEEGEGEGGEGPNKKFRLGAPCLTNLWNITEV